MVHVLEDAVLQGGADAYAVGDREVLHVLAQADAPRVRADRHAELPGHEEDGEDLVHTAQTAGIYLAEANGVCLQELLEDDAVLAVLARGDSYGSDGFRDPGVSQNVVGAGGFLHPPRVELLQVIRSIYGLVNLPDLVRIHHELPVGAYLLPDDR